MCVALALATGCAGMNGMMQSDSSGSNNSSGQSNQSSANSNQSSQGSKNSSDSNASSKQSTDNSSNNQNAQTSSWVLAGSALLVTVAVGVGLTLFFVIRARRNAAAQPTEEQAKQAAEWLDANLPQLKQDLALGAGPSLDDLAQAAEIPPAHRERFAALLQRHRAEILEPLDGPLGPQLAVRVLSRIGQLATEDALLLADALAFLERHGG